jgi:hypothetical protein
MSPRLREIIVPDFGVPAARPAIPAATYARRCDEAFARGACDWLVVYADREHLANIAYLTGFEPRFEEALLLLGRKGERIFVAGNECLSYTSIAGLPGCEAVLCQSLSLMGQDRSKRASLERVLRDCGLSAGQTIGLAGWKYLEPDEWDGEEAAFFAPSFLAQVLARISGGWRNLKDCTAVLMHPTSGLRSIVDADEIAALEWGAARSSAAVWRIVSQIKPGDSEFEAASRMGYAGEPLSCHMMLASSDGSAPVIGLRSPTHRRLAVGDGVVTAVGYWGGLSARGGLMRREEPSFLSKAAGYFEGLCAWYGDADIGAAGGDIQAAVEQALAPHELKPALNPGHLVSFDEWVNTPIRPRSQDRLASGMPFQVDIIPVPMKNGWTLNCEDAVVLADEALRAEIERKHPEVHARILARRAFMREELGVDLKPSILPLSSTPLCLPPFWVTPNRLLAWD